MGCNGLHCLHRGDFVVDVVQFAAGGEELDRNVRIARGNTARRCEACVLCVAGAEKNLVLGIILLEKGGQVLFEARFVTVKRLQQGQRRRKAGPLFELSQRQPPLTQIAGHRRQYHASKDRGSHEAEEGQCKKNVRHAGIRISGWGGWRDEEFQKLPSEVKALFILRGLCTG